MSALSRWLLTTDDGNFHILATVWAGYTERNGLAHYSLDKGCHHRIDII